jgi:hypothetical protein
MKGIVSWRWFENLGMKTLRYDIISVQGTFEKGSSFDTMSAGFRPLSLLGLRGER